MWQNKFAILNSLKLRLALWVLFPAALFMLMDLLLTYHNSSQIATAVQQQLLHGSAKIISEQLVFSDGAYEISIPPAAFELFKSKHKDRVFYSVHTRDGKLIAGDDELAPYPAFIQIEEAEYSVINLSGEPVRVIALAHSLTNSSSGDFAITQVGQTLRGHNEFRDALLWTTIRGHLILLAITSVSLFLALHWTLKPLMEFGNTLLRRQPGSLDRLEKESAPTELEPVIHALNDYVERLANTLFSYEKFVSDTAHHLRTSFAIITSQINFGKRNDCQSTVQGEILDAIQKTLGYCTKLINQLLVLASVEQTRKDRYVAQDVQLSELITTVIEEMAPLAQQRQIELGVDSFDQGIYIVAPVQLLHEVFSNLIDNAIQHMGKPGAVSISLDRQAGNVRFSITDNGPGIPQELHQKVFERFYRIDESRSNSSGLGLAIVKEICDSMDAKIKLSTPSSGIGLEIEILFPTITRPN